MNIKRFFVALALSASVCAFADPVYYFVQGSGFGGYTYSYSSSPSELVPVFFSEVVDLGDGTFCDPVTGEQVGVFAVPPSDLDFVLTFPYLPSNPAYTDPVAPAIDPLASSGGGGGGSPSGGGEEEGGGFDASGSLGVLPSFMSGLSTAVVGVCAVASLLCLSFLGWRKFRYSSKRI